jgi:hypothetical protein
MKLQRAKALIGNGEYSKAVEELNELSSGNWEVNN